MEADSTGSELPAYESRRNGATVLTGGSTSGDSYAPTLATAGTKSTGTSFEPLAQSVGGGRRTPIITPKNKHRCRALFSACLDSLDRAIDNNEEFFLRNNAIEQLRDTLSELWENRCRREEQFAETINMLQGIFAKRSVEDFSVTELACLRSAFVRISDQPSLNDDFVNDITIELLNGGIDVFRELE